MWWKAGRWSVIVRTAVARPKSPDHVALGSALRSFRADRGWTLEQLGERVPGEMNPRYISACERGEINASFGNLLRLCRALGVRLVELAARYEEERERAS
jgi:transcriptional regulator with XRE-family HTH domain